MDDDIEVVNQNSGEMEVPEMSIHEEVFEKAKDIDMQFTDRCVSSNIGDGNTAASMKPTNFVQSSIAIDQGSLEEIKSQEAAMEQDNNDVVSICSEPLHPSPDKLRSVKAVDQIMSSI